MREREWQKIEIIHMICDLCQCKNIFRAQQHQKISRIAHGEAKNVADYQTTNPRQ